MFWTRLIVGLQMNYFFITVLGNFLFAAILLGLNWSRRSPVSACRIVLVSVIAVVVGAWIGHSIPTKPLVLLYASLVQIVILFLFFISQKNQSPAVGYIWQGILIATSAFRWGQDRNLNSIAITNVVNTDFLLNVSAIVSGFILLAGFAVVVAALCCQDRRVRWPLLSLVTAFLLIPLLGECVLGLMKLKWLTLTSSHLSFAARATGFATQLPYVLPLIVLSVAALSIWTSVLPHRVACNTSDLIERRKALSAFRYSRGLAIGSLVLAFFIVDCQWYWDQIVSQPTTLSKTTRLLLNTDDLVHIPTAIFQDNDLHRFDWVADDGKVIRFFAINRFSDHPSLSVVYDSCMLCGDKGYALRDGRIVCIACGVKLFLPSVGTAGGCNPIPMNGWKISGDELLIPKESLEAGANYFTTVIAQKVIDPVGGEKFLSSHAKHSYEYAGKTYYFSNDKNYENFVSEPQKYTGSRKSCCGGL